MAVVDAPIAGETGACLWGDVNKAANCACSESIAEREAASAALAASEPDDVDHASMRAPTVPETVVQEAIAALAPDAPGDVVQAAALVMPAPAAAAAKDPEFPGSDALACTGKRAGSVVGACEDPWGLRSDHGAHADVCRDWHASRKCEI